MVWTITIEPLKNYLNIIKEYNMTTREFLDRYDNGHGGFEEQEIRNIIVYGFEDLENTELLETEYGENRRWSRMVYEY